MSQAGSLAIHYLFADPSAARRWLEPLSQLDLSRTSGGTLFAPWCAMLLAGAWAGVRLSAGLEPALGYVRAAALKAGVLLFAATSTAWAPRALTAHAVALLWLVSAAHFAGCAVDCRARGGWSCRAYLRSLCAALAHVAPASVPIALASSALLLAATSLLQLVHLEPERLRWLVRWGALHAPFWLVHLETRRNFASSPGLRADSGTVGAAAAKLYRRRDVDSLLPR